MDPACSITSTWGASLTLPLGSEMEEKFAYSMFYSVYKLFVECGCFLYGCSGWFVVEVDVFVGLFR